MFLPFEKNFLIFKLTYNVHQEIICCSSCRLFSLFFVCMWVIFFKMENTKFVQIFCTVHIFKISGPSSNCLTDSYLIKIFIMCAGLRLVVLHFRLYSQILILLYVSTILLYMQKKATATTLLCLLILVLSLLSYTRRNLDVFGKPTLKLKS